MNSNKKLVLCGKKKELEDQRGKIIIKLKGFSDLLIQHSETLLYDNFEEMDYEAIKVYAEELANQIKILRNNGKELKNINKQLGTD